MTKQVFVNTNFVLRIKPDTIREYKEIKFWVPILKKLMNQQVKKKTHELSTSSSQHTQPEETTHGSKELKVKLCSEMAIVE